MNNRTPPLARPALIAAAVIATFLLLARQGDSTKPRPQATAGRAPNAVAKSAADQGGANEVAGEVDVVAIPEATTIAVIGQQASEDKPARRTKPARP